MRPRLSNVLNAMSRLAAQIMLKQMTRMSRPKPREFPRRSVHGGRLGVQLNPRHRAQSFMKCGRQIYAEVAKAKEIEMSRPLVTSMSLSRAKQGAERKRGGQSRAYFGGCRIVVDAGERSISGTEAPAADVNAGVSHEIIR